MTDKLFKRLCMTALVVFLVCASSIAVHECVHVVQYLNDENASNIRFIFTTTRIYVVADYDKGIEQKLSWYDAESQAFSVQFIYIVITLLIYCFRKDIETEERFKYS